MLAGVAGLLTLYAAPVDAGEAPPVDVAASGPWTPTGVTVAAGDTVQISAQGTMHLGDVEALAVMGPDGIPWGPLCLAVEEGPSTNWIAPELDCWSLIARIGEGAPIAIGSQGEFVAETDGPLSLGVNDTYFPDNTGAWTAQIVVEPGTGVAVPTPGSDSGGGGAGGLLLVLLALVILAAGILLAIWLRRRRRAGDEAMAPVAAAAALASAVHYAGEAPPTAGQETVVPGEDDAIDVNIFEVTILERASLRVGYNFFPEGTSVHWRLAQNGTARSHGQFVTLGGGLTYHFVVQPIVPHLPPDGGSIDVDFDWTIEGVPFGYSVRRVPSV